jgi:hypothetical protein
VPRGWENCAGEDLVGKIFRNAEVIGPRRSGKLVGVGLYFY